MLALRLLAEGGEGPNTELLWLLWVLLGFFALVVIAGWVAASRKPKQAAVKAEAVSSPVKKKAADDLVKIEGIGTKVVKVLARAGIETFDELANAKTADVQKVLDKAGLQMMDPAGWIDQAKLAAKGDWEAFDKLQRKLKGGRKK
jgi:predicted flap endonuclease-1-like 5' DNA nuclease